MRNSHKRLNSFLSLFPMCINTLLHFFVVVCERHSSIFISFHTCMENSNSLQFKINLRSSGGGLESCCCSGAGTKEEKGGGGAGGGHLLQSDPCSWRGQMIRH